MACCMWKNAKDVSPISKKKRSMARSCPARSGIGHTRWATHGEPNDINSHPHLSQNGKIALVHNGIIENYLEIRTFLEEKA